MPKLLPAILAAILLLSPAAQAKRAPNLELKILAGDPIHLADLRGSIVVLSFWATWCAPCQQELPRLSALSRQYAGKNIRFVAISVDEPKDLPKIAPFVRDHNLQLDVWTGADLDMLERVGLGNVLPGTLIPDQPGEIVARIQGEARDPDITAPLDWLLAGKLGTAPAPITKRY